MNLFCLPCFLLSISLSAFISDVESAPAVTSVHVSFVSGNKATQYSHGSNTDASQHAYKLADKDKLGSHVEKRSVLAEDNEGKRSVSERPKKIMSQLIRKHVTTVKTSQVLPASPTTRSTKKFTKVRPNTKPSDKSTQKFKVVGVKGTRRPKDKITMSKLRQAMVTERIITPKPGGVRTNLLNHFVPNLNVHIISDAETQSKTVHEEPINDTNDDSLDTSQLSIVDHDVTQHAKKTDGLKDTKAVKRSPNLDNTFGIDFPKFNEFGGRDFGTLSDFGGSLRSNSIVSAAPSHTNPESLAPEGLFLPPLTVEEAAYADPDPYVADSETAKYAAQHPPYFSTFPHKRTMVDLNKRREAQGLEPNILRSIRPYFAFFHHAKKHYSPEDVHYTEKVATVPVLRDDPVYALFGALNDPVVNYYSESVIFPSLSPSHAR